MTKKKKREEKYPNLNAIALMFIFSMLCIIPGTYNYIITPRTDSGLKKVTGKVYRHYSKTEYYHKLTDYFYCIEIAGKTFRSNSNDATELMEEKFKNYKNETITVWYLEDWVLLSSHIYI
jgi:hypothetical protein